MRLYSSAQVLDALPKETYMIKIDLRNGFFQIPIHPDHVDFYGVYHRHQRYFWTRLPMDHAVVLM
jgi:hypothetical protein